MLNWTQESGGWWTAITPSGRNLTLHQHREQPEYWLFFRGDGNEFLICGPTLEDAKAFAERWLKAVRFALDQSTRTFTAGNSEGI